MKVLKILGLALCLATSSLGAADTQTEKTPRIAVVNFRKCVEESKLGVKEQENFDGLKEQIQTSLQEREKELNDMAMKFNDPDYLDSLSPEAEAEMKDKYRTMTQEFGQMQNRYYQAMNQANYKIAQTIHSSVAEAAQQVADKEHFDFVLNEDHCFFFAEKHDITTKVIGEMDGAFERSTADAEDAAEGATS